MQRLGLMVDEYEDPNSKARADESGADVVVVCGGRRIGIQVTDLDTGAKSGDARRDEKRLAEDAASRCGVYGTFAQNDPNTIIAAIKRSIGRKALISFAGFEKFWLLVCCGVPELGAVAATFVMTPWLDTGALDRATADMLSRSKYSRAFIHAILGAEEKALYQWERGGCWSKSTVPVPPDEQKPDFLQYRNNPELRSDPEGWCRQEVEKILGRKIDFLPRVQYSDGQHIVYWIDKATGETKRFPADGIALSINEWHAMIFAFSVVKSKAVVDVWVADQNGVRVADREKIADFANAHGYL